MTAQTWKFIVEPSEAHLRLDQPGQLAVGGVAGADGNDVTTDRPADQRQIAKDVQDFVPDELVRVAERFGGEDGVFTTPIAGLPADGQRLLVHVVRD